MPRTRSLPRLAALGLLLAAAGCSGSRVKVEGDVTLDGKALGKTMVTLTPVGGKGRPAHGLSDENGHFSLTCDSKDTVPAGDYKVTFAPAADTSIDNFKPDPNIDPAKRVREMQDKARKDQEQARKRGEGLHNNYVKVDTTPVTLKVPPEGPVKFSLTSDGTGR